MLKRTRFELRRAGQGKRPRPRADGGSIASHPIAPGKVLVSFAPLGRDLSGGIFFALVCRQSRNGVQNFPSRAWKWVGLLWVSPPRRSQSEIHSIICSTLTVAGPKRS